MLIGVNLLHCTTTCYSSRRYLEVMATTGRLVSIAHEFPPIGMCLEKDC